MFEYFLNKILNFDFESYIEILPLLILLNLFWKHRTLVIDEKNFI